jgi:hypothetical protein
MPQGHSNQVGSKDVPDSVMVVDVQLVQGILLDPQLDKLGVETLIDQNCRHLVIALFQAKGQQRFESSIGMARERLLGWSSPLSKY